MQSKGRVLLCPWTNEDDHLTWTVQIPSAGRWNVESRTRTRKASKAILTLGTQKRTVDIPAKGTPLRPARSEFGSFEIETPGTYTLHLKSAKTNGKWIPFDVYSLSLNKQ
jgi:hypothetical protein